MEPWHGVHGARGPMDAMGWGPCMPVCRYVEPWMPWDGDTWSRWPIGGCTEIEYVWFCRKKAVCSISVGISSA